MNELVITACLIIGGQCKEITIPSYQDESQYTTPYACMVGGQIAIAQWLEAHPKYVIQKWKCQAAGLESDL